MLNKGCELETCLNEISAESEVHFQFRVGPRAKFIAFGHDAVLNKLSELSSADLSHQSLRPAIRAIWECDYR